MKNLLLTIALLVTISATAFCQKIGYLSKLEISDSMPEVSLAKANLETERKRKEDELQAGIASIQQKYVDLERNVSTISQEQAQQIYQQIQQEEQSLNQKYQQLAVQFENRVQEVLAPLDQKINDAIKSVAQEMGLDYVINSDVYTTTRVIVYGEDQYDITQKVKAKL